MVPVMKDDLKSVLRKKLSSKELASVYRSYDVIGDIAIIRVPEQLSSIKETIAKALMLHHKSVNSVWRQSSPVSGEFRLRELEWIAGEKMTETIHKEHGSLFRVDVLDCYFSPRLSFERIRIANLVRDNEVVVNMFAGVGSYSIVIAKKSKASKIYSIDINPTAVRYMRENVLLNKVVDRVLPIKGDAKVIIEQTLKRTADRVLMPLPESAHKYLNSAVSAVGPHGGWIHYYGFEHARKLENPIEKVKANVAEKLQQQNVDFELPCSRIVRETGPNWYQIAIDIQVEK